MSAKIKIIDELLPEDVAMLQALYSRSPASVDSHLDKVEEVGSGNFMDRYYVGYGHRSIGDCGTTTMFIEGVTMLTAKAIQDWPLYSGQESSTRYMDFSTAEFNDPVGSAASMTILEGWRKFYLDSLPRVRSHIRERYPRNEGEDEKTYERAVNARCFDVMRSFLPAGAMTNLSWHTNLRQAADKLSWLAFHPEPTVRDVANQLWDGLKERYPHSFKEPRPEHAEYYSKAMRKIYFYERLDAHDIARLKSGVNVSFCINPMTLTDEERRFLGNRPRGASLPHWLSDAGTITSQFLLDFGSYRDIQRHRNGVIRMPLLTTSMGFNDWYLDELPEDLRNEANALIKELKGCIDSLECSEHIRQNYIAMGFNVPCKVTQSLPALIYRLELRSGKTVHPTLRRVVHEEIRMFKSVFPDINLHVDMDEDSWTVRRGKQTIEEKPASNV